MPRLSLYQRLEVQVQQASRVSLHERAVIRQVERRRRRQTASNRECEGNRRCNCAGDARTESAFSPSGAQFAVLCDVVIVYLRFAEDLEQAESTTAYIYGCVRIYIIVYYISQQE